MKKIFITLLLLPLLATEGKAQQLLGLRAGWFSGITYQHYIGSNTALEGILQWNRNWVNVTGLYQIHKDVSDIQNLKWYYGAGAHIGSYTFRQEDPFLGSRRTSSGIIIGADGIIGLEYFFEEIPIQISLDYKPMLNLWDGLWLYNDGALSVRYTF